MAVLEIRDGRQIKSGLRPARPVTDNVNCHPVGTYEGGLMDVNNGSKAYARILTPKLDARFDAIEVVCCPGFS